MNRKDFLKASLLAAAGTVISLGVSKCSSNGGQDDKPSDNKRTDYPQSNEEIGFFHGVKSGDPRDDCVIIWTRITPLAKGKEIKDTSSLLKTFDLVKVEFQVAKDADFTRIVNRGETYAKQKNDFTVKIDVQNLDAATKYYYRFICRGAGSVIGETKTLPALYSTPEKAKFAVFSCANYPNGHFNAYSEAAKIQDLDVAIHLGDYIYEYGSYKDDDFGKKIPAYANKHAKDIGRALPKDNNRECVKLQDYRRRYRLYATDPGLQALHSKVPMIMVWDDHEVCNNSRKESAENHQDGKEGPYGQRVSEALQAYFEWMPIRPVNNRRKIFRNFHFGQLLTLHMLETRLFARTKEKGMFDVLLNPNINNELKSSNNKLMGDEQLSWLKNEMTHSNAIWQVLGQQVVMGRMLLPIPEKLFLFSQLGVDITKLKEYISVIKGSVFKKKQRITPAVKALFENLLKFLKRAVADKEKMAQGKWQEVDLRMRHALQGPTPYNPDAWDGYYHEREELLKSVHRNRSNLVVLSGDTHNSWANHLYLDDKAKTAVGVEFGGCSVSSPGMEEYLGYFSKAGKMTELEDTITRLVDGLQYCNLQDRGFMEVEFTTEKASCTWHYVSTNRKPEYVMQKEREKTLWIKRGEKTFST